MKNLTLISYQRLLCYVISIILSLSACMSTVSKESTMMT